MWPRRKMQARILQEPMEETHQPDLLFVGVMTILTGFALFFMFISSVRLHAAEIKDVTCPVAGQKCKVIVLSPDEENLLIKPQGVLDTASAGRYIDLGNVVAYFRVKLMQAAEGQVQPLPVTTSATPTPSIKPTPGAEGGAPPSRPKGGDAK